jgi:HAE1 family hydrophobic/amphiphilic exporter-1
MIIGGEEREIRVLVDPERLAARQLTYAELDAALRRGFLDRRGGTVETATRQIVVRTEGRSHDPQELASIVVRRDARGTVRVGDVARIEDAYRELTSVVHANGENIVALGVRREPGANVVTMIDGVDAEMARLNAGLADRGLDLRLVAAYRDTTYLHKAIDFVRSNLIAGSALAVLVLLFFLRSLRSVLVVAASIPVSLLTVFLVMDALGRTLNVISMAGLAFAAGMVVDNAIVVLENIFRHLEMGKKPRQAAIDGGEHHAFRPHTVIADQLAVVAGIEDHGIVVLTAIFEGGENLTDLVVEKRAQSKITRLGDQTAMVVEVVVVVHVTANSLDHGVTRCQGRAAQPRRF